MALDLNTLESTLQKQQWVGGQAPSDADAATFDALKGKDINADSHPHAFAWFCLVWKFSDNIRNGWSAGGAKAGGKGGDKKGGKKGGKDTKKADDDELDLFGDDDDEPAAKVKVEVKKPKKVVIAMSLVMLEVKPLDSDTNLDDLAKKIFAEVTNEKGGLFWKTEFKKEPVAFGIFKLIVGFSCEDEKVSVDDIVEKVEAFEDLV